MVIDIRVGLNVNVSFLSAEKVAMNVCVAIEIGFDAMCLSLRELNAVIISMCIQESFWLNVI